ncbi:MAG: phosphoribosylaminoimidazolesuccinocarboxamide synthase [Candidatus Bathyarchaeia archaeon]
MTNAENVVLETHLPHPLFKRGKVRDVYDLGDKLLIVSTDRISAFDVVLPNGIPHKGEAITRLSTYWFSQTKDIIPNHIIETVDSRTVLVKKAKLVPIEFVIRGYLYGAAWENYKQGKPICGIKLPKGLQKAQKLPTPILTPTTKADVGHDIEITHKDMEQKIGKQMATYIKEVCMQIYEKASQRAEQNGIIVADTKLEFGTLKNGEIILIDELLTPDSSRFWPQDKYRIGEDQPSFDKQYVRDYLLSIKWNKQPPAPTLPPHVVAETSKKYIEAYERLTGRKF